MQNVIAIENEKRKLSEFSGQDRCTGKDSDVSPQQNVRCKYYNLWRKLIASDWFAYFLQYLELKDIANLDSSFCNHDDRMHWLILLKQYCAPYVYIEEKKSGNILINWLLIKKSRR